MTSLPGTPERAFRVAIVGSGPSGFYAAESLLGSDLALEVEMFDSLPTPFGLVRYGVAPDHAKIKKIISRYERTAAQPGFSFLGNVEVGRDISVSELRRYCDVVIFASGAQTDRRLGIPGEDLSGSYTATEFVAWYNGHPDYQDREFDLNQEVVSVIGQGNVAIDVARILCKTVDELKYTDITARALEVLAESKVKEVHMIGRRGPVQAAFTPPEIKEFSKLEDCDPIIVPEQLELNQASIAELEELKWRDARKNYETLTEYASRKPSGRRRRFIVDFYTSPVELLGEERLEGVVFERNRLAGEPGKQWAEGTGERFMMECGALFRSVGYRGIPIDGVPFNEKRGVFDNEAGRLLEGGSPIPGLYAVGWIKRGPSGVIGTNKPDSIETAKNVVADAALIPPCKEPDGAALRAALGEKGIVVVDYEGWQKIDAVEIERGGAAGKPREKLLTIEEMLAASGV